MAITNEALGLGTRNWVWI